MGKTGLSSFVTLPEDVAQPTFAKNAAGQPPSKSISNQKGKNGLCVFLTVMAVVSVIGGVVSLVIFIGNNLVLAITYLITGILSACVLSAIANTLDTVETVQCDVAELKRKNAEISEKLDRLLSAQSAEAAPDDDPNAPRCIRCKAVLPQGYAGNICPRCRDQTIRNTAPPSPVRAFPA